MAKRHKLPFDEQRKVAIQRQNLLNRLTEGNVKSPTDKVAFILNHYPDARDSNITLSIRYYEEFHPEYIKDGWIQLKSFHELPKMYDMQRVRARIQNDYGLFLARKDVRERRMQLAEDARLQYGGQGDIFPTLTVYSDESGKDRDYTTVGTIWFYDAISVIELVNMLKQWKRDKNHLEEFKFNELTYGSLPLIKDFFRLTISQTDTISFKAVAIQTKNAQLNYDQLVYRLYYETFMKGVDFELSHNRIALPKIIFLHKDKDTGSDALWFSDLERKLSHDCSTLHNGQLHIDQISALPSEQHELLQVADLFTGSISRLLNRNISDKKNQKDEFAEYVCGLLSIDPTSLEVDFGVDWVMTHIFRQ